METKDIILEILKKLEKSLDDDNFDQQLISAETFGITVNRRNYILQIMEDAGLIKGVKALSANDRAPYGIMLKNLKITLQGIMYLDENTTTAKIIKAAKILKDTIPMI